jgi:hypothetical protein
MGLGMGRARGGYTGTNIDLHPPRGPPPHPLSPSPPRRRNDTRTEKHKIEHREPSRPQPDERHLVCSSWKSVCPSVSRLGFRRLVFQPLQLFCSLGVFEFDIEAMYDVDRGFIESKILAGCEMSPRCEMRDASVGDEISMLMFCFCSMQG